MAGRLLALDDARQAVLPRWLVAIVEAALDPRWRQCGPTATGRSRSARRRAERRTLAAATAMNATCPDYTTGEPDVQRAACELGSVVVAATKGRAETEPGFRRPNVRHQPRRDLDGAVGCMPC